jgi:hypothetical protein
VWADGCGLGGSGPIATEDIVGRGGPEPEVARVESREDGAFEFAAVEPGEWRLSVEAGVEDDQPQGGAASAVVSEKDVEDIRIRLAAPFAAEVTEARGDAQAPPERFGNGLDTAVLWGGRDVTGQVVELTPGAASFQMVYKSGLGRVRGTVEKGEGSMVMLVPRDTGEITTMRTSVCGADGAFEIDGVIPGDYSLVAFDRASERGTQWDALLSIVASIATSLRVEAGSAAPVELRMNKWPW